MDPCTSHSTTSITCSTEDSTCCCRALEIKDLDIKCSDTSFIPELLATRNETKCSCSPCDDVTIKIRLRVKGQGSGGPIAAAQVFDMGTEELIGLTLYNGVLDFELRYTKKELQVLVQATGYQRATRNVPLSPRQPAVAVNITMTMLMVKNIGRGDSEIAYPLGERAWLYTQPGAFRRNGTAHEHDVIFKGSYVDSSSPGVLETIESENFEVDGTLFGMVAAMFLEFEDGEGEPLDTNDLRLVVPIGKEEDLADVFVVEHNWETGSWTKSSAFSPVKTRRGKRATISEVILEAPDITTQVFMMIAVSVGADCWAQVRTFDAGLNPFPGPFVMLEQRRVVSGMDILYRFGTDTGGAQTTFESLASNAVCLPLDCNFFIEVVITARVDPSTNLVPVDFPPGTFPPGSPAQPDITSNAFTFTAIDPADMMGTLSPTYVFKEHCVYSSGTGIKRRRKSERFLHICH